MSAEPTYTVIGENLSDDGRVPAPRRGWSREVGETAGGLQRRLEDFAALPSFEAEEADARLHVKSPRERVTVRWAGGKLGIQAADTFVPATVGEIFAQISGRPAADAGPVAAEDPVAPVPPAKPPRKARRQRVVLAVLVAAMAVLAIPALQPEPPEGVEWIEDADERIRILAAAGGFYPGEDERLQIDGKAARLTVTGAEGEEVLATSLRPGRKAGAVVLATEAGVLLEVAGAGRIRANGSEYRRAD